MTYPDGSQIHVGDLIWWDEGLCVGYVQAIAESREDYESWGLDSPHIFVSNRHPFDPSLATSGGVAYGASFLEDDGIGPLSAVERLEFERATQLALSLAGVTPVILSPRISKTPLSSHGYSGCLMLRVARA